MISERWFIMAHWAFKLYLPQLKIQKEKGCDVSFKVGWVQIWTYVVYWLHTELGRNQDGPSSVLYLANLGARDHPAALQDSCVDKSWEEGMPFKHPWGSWWEDGIKDVVLIMKGKMLEMSYSFGSSAFKKMNVNNIICSNLRCHLNIINYFEWNIHIPLTKYRQWRY